MSGHDGWVPGVVKSLREHGSALRAVEASRSSLPDLARSLAQPATDDRFRAWQQRGLQELPGMCEQLRSARLPDVERVSLRVREQLAEYTRLVGVLHAESASAGSSVTHLAQRLESTRSSLASSKARAGKLWSDHVMASLGLALSQGLVAGFLGGCFGACTANSSRGDAFVASGLGSAFIWAFLVVMFRLVFSGKEIESANAQVAELGSSISQLESELATAQARAHESNRRQSELRA